tara:strand:- start:1026 stop:1955 length:930 start_codon:yes stop_codon:yes gene_type:complete
MNNNLYTIKPKRLFTFGCSFTKYSWGTWANILAKELEPVEYINLGKSGAGNQYIFNMLMQADAVYDFTHEDLVVVQWTNVCREDRYIPQKKDSGPWVTPGNIYSQEEYDTNFVMNYFSEKGAYIRDLAFIKAAHEMLKHKAQWHFLQMCDIVEQPNQWSEATQEKRIDWDQELDELLKFYNPTLSHLKASFYDILWNNNMDNKIKKDKKLINNSYIDGHPSPIEHLMYLKGVFKHKWKDSTDRAVELAQSNWVKLLRDASKKGNVIDSKGNKRFALYMTKKRYQEMFFHDTKVIGTSYRDPRIIAGTDR